ncbi:hypothetical protein HHI36_004511 [Cryptolaemus montrouzieri]|uniref:Uncharacterized protein n=1 Tax=Cryptolaemus montrouzieri TaxID=559131 RepID=A0ABD2NT09_9CUCU
MTEIAIPLQPSICSDDAGEDISFKVLNQDNLPMTVLGERIFKPFGSDHQKRKPNGIVYPTRRLDLSNLQVNQQKHLTKSNGHLELPTKISSNGNFKKLSYSHGNLNQISKNKSPDNFTKNLDAKLKKLQNEKKKNDDSLKRPFITTVRKGKFLEAPEKSPPNSKTVKNDEEELNKKCRTPKKQLYAYVSKPMVLCRSPPQNVHRSRCEAAAIAAGLTFAKGLLEEENTDMQKQHRKKREAIIAENTLPEKRCFKEISNQTQQKNDLPKWNPNFAYARLLSQEDTQLKETRAEMAKRRAIARKKAKIQFDKTAQQTAMSQVPQSIQLKEVYIQTDNYLEASLIKPPIIDMHTQTEFEVSQGKSINIEGSLKKLQDEETQIFPDDLYDFEEEVEPVLEVLVGKTIESALIEILEEEELAALKEQQRKFLEVRAEEQREAEELFEKHLVDQMKKKNARNASILLESYLESLIPPVLVELEAEGVLSDKECK